MAENECPNFAGLFTAKVIKSHVKLHVKSDAQKVNSACAKMFADYTTITISDSSLADLEQETNLELLNLHCWLKANKQIGRASCRERV